MAPRLQYYNTTCMLDFQLTTAANICEHLMPCRNGGTCTSSGNDSYRCLCSDLYTGNNCEMLNEDETMSTAIMDVELESSGEIDDLFPNTTLETETPGCVAVM